MMEVEAEDGIFRVFVLLPEQVSSTENHGDLRSMHTVM